MKWVLLCPVLYMYISLAYDLSCPDPSQVHLRRQHCHNVSKYACLEDLNKNNTFRESCNEEPYRVRQGRRYVFRGNSTFEICPTNTYQPVPSVKGLYTMCILLKSACNELGQVLSSNTSETEDSTCRCDHSTGYTYVNKPKDIYKCTPSEEDCTCYRWQCPSNGCLSADYECIEANTTQCTSMVDTRLSSGSGSVPTTTVEIQTLQKGDIELYNSKYVSIPACVLFICAFTVIIFYIKKWQILWSKFGSRLVSLLCLNEKKQQSTTTELKDFNIRIIGHWKLLKAALNLEIIFPILVKYRFISQPDCDDQQKNCPNDKQDFVLYSLLTENKSCVAHRNQILLQQCTLNEILQRNVDKPLWHKRSIEVCQKQLEAKRKLLEAMLDPQVMTDDFLQNFIFDLKQHKNIMSLPTKSEKIRMFLKHLEDTLYRGSFQCLLTQMKRNDRFSQLFTALTKDLVQASLESGTIYCTEKVQDFRNVQVLISIKTTITWNDLIDTAMRTCCDWLIEEFALSPVDTSKNCSGLLLFPLVADFETRLHQRIKQGAMARFLEIIFETDEIRSTFKEPFKVNVTVRTEKPDNIIEYFPNSFVEQADEHNIISLNKSFIIWDEFNYTLLKTRLIEKGYDFLSGIPVNESIDQDRFIEKLDTQMNDTFLPIFFEILEADCICSAKLKKRLLISSKVHATESPFLREKLIENFSGLVYVMTDIEDFKEIVTSGNIYPEDFFSTIEHNCKENRQLQEILIHILKSGRRDAMLALVETLYINDHDLLASDILYLEPGVLQVSDLDEALRTTNITDSGDGLFFTGDYEICL